MKSSLRKNNFLLLLSFLFFTINTFGQSPTISKIEPPNWWAGMQWNTVQLMVYGKNLDGITARFQDERLQIKTITTPTNASYAFLDVTIPNDLPSGEYTLILKREKQETKVNYPILQRANTAGKHQGFGPEDVIYLITPDRFANGDTKNDRIKGGLDDFDRSQPGKRHGGDLQGVIDRLDYLQDLGVTALWLNPILENSGQNSYHGYAATDLYQVDARFGTNEDYKRLVEEAHRRDLKVIFDHVNNHIGIRHPWIQNLPMEDWLNGSVKDHLLEKHYLQSISDPHADPQSEELLKTFWFVDAMPDLDQRNPFLAKYLIQNTLWWMEYTGLDAIREDTYPYPDQAFLADWAEAILTEYPNSNIVGEIWNNHTAYIAQFQQKSFLPRAFETNLPSVMDFPLSEACRDYLAGTGRLRGVYDVFAQDYLYTDLDNLLVFIDNHDMTRGIFHAKGNTAKVKQMLALILTSRGIPQLLYGTEINMLGGESHVELRADFPGGFPNDDRDAFTAEGRTAEENEVFDFLQKLLQLRQKHPALSKGTFIHYPLTWNNEVYKYLKIDGEEKVLVIINGYDEERPVDLSELQGQLGEKPAFRNLLTGEKAEVGTDGTKLRIGASGILVLEVE